jgi:ADP-ribose pyrophosphatase YjhB (NUDIX family)
MVGVGTFIMRDGRVLLVKRGSAPGAGKWSIPGGLVHVGETVEAAAVREAREESGLSVRLEGLVGVVNRIIPDAEGRVQYHYVLIDFVASAERGEAVAGSDAVEVRWVPVSEVSQYDTTEGLAEMVGRAIKLLTGETER